MFPINEDTLLHYLDKTSKFRKVTQLHYCHLTLRWHWVPSIFPTMSFGAEGPKPRVVFRCHLSLVSFSGRLPQDWALMTLTFLKIACHLQTKSWIFLSLDLSDFLVILSGLPTRRDHHRGDTEFFSLHPFRDAGSAHPNPGDILYNHLIKGVSSRVPHCKATLPLVVNGNFEQQNF